MSGVSIQCAQPSLFDRVRPLSRSVDCITSHEAEASLRSSGKLNAQCAETLNALRAFLARLGEAPTASELAQGDPARENVFHKRLPDLRAAGLVANPAKRVCRVTGTSRLTWVAL